MQTGEDACASVLRVRRRLRPEAHFLSGVYSAVVTQPQPGTLAASAQSKVNTTASCAPQSSFVEQLQVGKLLNTLASALKLQLSFSRIKAKDEHRSK